MRLILNVFWLRAYANRRPSHAPVRHVYSCWHTIYCLLVIDTLQQSETSDWRNRPIRDDVTLYIKTSPTRCIDVSGWSRIHQHSRTIQARVNQPDLSLRMHQGDVQGAHLHNKGCKSHALSRWADFFCPYTRVFQVWLWLCSVVVVVKKTGSYKRGQSVSSDFTNTIQPSIALRKHSLHEMIYSASDWVHRIPHI